MKQTEIQNSAVSVIVPVYKVEAPYFRECVDSILKQTLTDLEIILIDDGSPDSCGEICDAYARQDARVRVIHQENQGASVARNRGIEAARGKWLTFVDADDWLCLEACEKAVQSAEKANADVLYFALHRNGKNSSVEMRLPLLGEGLSKIEERRRLWIDILEFGVTGFTVCKLYRSDRLKQSNVRYPPGCLLSEDMIFQMLAVQEMENFAYLDECLYYYRMRATSAGGRYRNDAEICYTQAARKMEAILSESSLTDKAVCKAFARCVFFFYVMIVQMQILHSASPLSYREKKAACAAIANKPLYKEAIAKKNVRYTGVKRKISHFLIRENLFGLYIMLKRVLNWKGKKANVEYA